MRLFFLLLVLAFSLGAYAALTQAAPQCAACPAPQLKDQVPPFSTGYLGVIIDGEEVRVPYYEDVARELKKLGDRIKALEGREPPLKCKCDEPCPCKK